MIAAHAVASGAVLVTNKHAPSFRAVRALALAKGATPEAALPLSQRRARPYNAAMNSTRDLFSRSSLPDGRLRLELKTHDVLGGYHRRNRSRRAGLLFRMEDGGRATRRCTGRFFDHSYSAHRHSSTSAAPAARPPVGELHANTPDHLCRRTSHRIAAAGARHRRMARLFGGSGVDLA